MIRYFGSFLIECVKDVCFDWRLLALGKLELRLSWLEEAPELDTVIIWRDGDLEREVVTAGSFGIFDETDYPEVFKDDFDGFQLYHRATYGALKGSESFSVHVMEHMPVAIEQTIETLRACEAEDYYTPPRNKRAWREWDHSRPGWGKRARHGHRWQGWNDTEYPWRRCAKGDQERPRKNRKARLFHDPAVGKWCRNNRSE